MRETMVGEKGHPSHLCLHPRGIDEALAAAVGDNSACKAKVRSKWSISIYS